MAVRSHAHCCKEAESTIDTHSIRFKKSLAKHMAWCLGHPPFSLSGLLGDGHQAQSGLVTDIMALTSCIDHANGSPQSCHWCWLSNGGQCVHSHLCMRAPPNFSIKGMHTASQGLLFG